MKTLKSFMLLVGILLGSTVFYSCLDEIKIKYGRNI